MFPRHVAVVHSVELRWHMRMCKLARLFPQFVVDYLLDFLARSVFFKIVRHLQPRKWKMRIYLSKVLQCLLALRELCAATMSPHNTVRMLVQIHSNHTHHAQTKRKSVERMLWWWQAELSVLYPLSPLLKAGQAGSRARGRLPFGHPGLIQIEQHGVHRLDGSRLRPC